MRTAVSATLTSAVTSRSITTAETAVFKQCLQHVCSLCLVLPELVPEAVTVLATVKSKARTQSATAAAAAVTSSMSADQKRLRDYIDAALQNVLARSES
jgi:hypothetical protein